MLDKISHIAMIVKDPSKSAALFKDLFNSRIVQRIDADGHEETFVQVGQTWLVFIKAALERQRTGDHIAFLVSTDTLLACVEKLKSMKHEFILAREKSALYFFDYDNHVFELDTFDLNGDLVKAILL